MNLPQESGEENAKAANKKKIQGNGDTTHNDINLYFEEPVHAEGAVRIFQSSHFSLPRG